MYTRMYMRCLQALLNPTIDTGAGRALSTAYGLARTAWMTTCMYHKPSEKPWMRSTYQRIVLGPLIGRSSSVSQDIVTGYRQLGANLNKDPRGAVQLTSGGRHSPTGRCWSPPGNLLEPTREPRCTGGRRRPSSSQPLAKTRRKQSDSTPHRHPAHSTTSKRDWRKMGRSTRRECQAGSSHLITSHPI